MYFNIIFLTFSTQIKRTGSVALFLMNQPEGLHSYFYKRGKEPHRAQEPLSVVQQSGLAAHKGMSNLQLPIK